METETFVVNLEKLEAIERNIMRKHHCRLREQPTRRCGNRKILRLLRVWRGSNLIHSPEISL